MMRLLWLLGLLVAAVVAAPVRNCATHPWPYNNTLLPGEELHRGDFLQSSTALLVFDTSGNVVLYRKKPEMYLLWATNTSDSGATRFVFEMDGSLSLYDHTNKIWTNGKPSGQIAVVQDDCNFVVYKAAPLDQPIWASGSNKCNHIHIVPHTHDDVGWLLTPERYYDGCYNPTGGIRFIISTVVEALVRNPLRKFSYVEMYFFERWWKEQNQTTKEVVRGLVKRGQLEFVNAGWSMHDEACVHQEAAVSNMAIGAQFLQREFGNSVRLNTGWHLDPFGHASATTQLMAELGFDSFFFQRQDYQQRDFMREHKLYETVWRPSQSLGDSVMMFTSIMYNGYCFGCDVHVPGERASMCVSPFCCYNCQQYSPIHYFEELYRQHRAQTTLDDLARGFRLNLESEYSAPTIKQLAEAYTASIAVYAGAFRTHHVLVPWGCDFTHMHAEEDYSLMDAVIAEVNSNPLKYGMTMLYSTPSHYIKSVHALGYSWPQNDYDYFLDSDNGNAYWSGYFTSRPAYKGYERYAMNERYAVETALSSLAVAEGDPNSTIEHVSTLQQACGVSQHHDCITGTERRDVLNQYNSIIADGISASDKAFDAVFTKATGLPSGFEACHLANLSSCAATEGLGSRNVSVFVYNPLQRRRHEIITIPVPSPFVKAVQRTMKGSRQLVVDVARAWNLTHTVDTTAPNVKRLPFQLTFALDMNPNELLEIVLYVSPAESRTAPLSAVRPPLPFTIKNEVYQATFDETGLLTSVTDLRTNTVTPIRQNLLHYCPHDNGREGREQASGAYIFRTCEPNEAPQPFSQTAELVELVQGAVCQEVRQVLNSAQNMHQSFRLCKGQDFLEITTGAGELDAGRNGLEVIMKFTTDIASKGVWFTDSYALEMQQRVRNSRPNYPYTVTEPVASNYFPCNAFTVLNDTKKALAVVGDRSRGVASLHDGELEFLVHRRLVWDDSRGVGQPLNEDTRLLSTSRIYASSDVVGDMRIGSLLLTHRPIIRFGSMTRSGSPFWGFEGTAPELPPNVHLHTRTLLEPRTMLIRLQHLFSVNEGPHSAPAVVDIKSVMPQDTEIQSLVETDMNGVYPLSSMNRLSWEACDLTTQTRRTVPPRPRSPIDPSKGTTVSLHAMEIRTFRVVFEWVK